MNSIRVDLSLDQIKQALRKLPAQEKIAIWRMLDADLDRPAIARRFDASVKSIRKAYVNVSEEEVMADAVKAAHEARKTRNAKNRS